MCVCVCVYIITLYLYLSSYLSLPPLIGKTVNSGLFDRCFVAPHLFIVVLLVDVVGYFFFFVFDLARIFSEWNKFLCFRTDVVVIFSFADFLSLRSHEQDRDVAVR